jgi:hypothetical protein
MNNELVEHKSWWQVNLKWIVALSVIILITIAFFFTSGMNSIASNLVQAYADKELYEKALEKVVSNQEVTRLLGKIELIDKMAILEGEVVYSNNNKTVNSTIRLVGTKGKARMDISAIRINNTWNYTKISVRIKNPPEKKQTIEVLTTQ